MHIAFVFTWRSLHTASDLGIDVVRDTVRTTGHKLGHGRSWAVTEVCQLLREEDEEARWVIHSVLGARHKEQGHSGYRGRSSQIATIVPALIAIYIIMQASSHTHQGTSCAGQGLQVQNTT